MARFQVSWAGGFLLAGLLLTASAPCRGNPPYATPADDCPWAGVWPTVVTPFRDGGVDIPSLEAQLHRELRAGCRGLLVLGTIGEGEYVTGEERRQVIATAVRVAAGRASVVVGIHTCDVGTADKLLLEAKELGVSAVLVKFLGKPDASPAEVLDFYTALSNMQCLPIIYYHYPKETRLRLRPHDIAAILSLPEVIGIKESTLDLAECREHIHLTQGLGKVYFIASALELTQFLELGGHGVMCPEAVLLPEPTVEAYNAYVHGRLAEARGIQRCLFAAAPIVDTNAVAPALTGPVLMAAADCTLPLPMRVDYPQAQLKVALDAFGVPTSPAVKPPLPPLTSRQRERVLRVVRQLKATDWSESALSVPPEPLHTTGQDQASGLFLRTGAIQLGSGLGRNFWRWQGDGEWGF